MSAPSSSLLSLPDPALYSILDRLIPGGLHAHDSPDLLDRAIPLDHHARDAYTLFGDRPGPTGDIITFSSYSAEFHTLVTSCTRLNDLYRARVRHVKLSRAYLPAACARLWARFPAVDGLSLFLGHSLVIGGERTKDKILQDADADAEFICEALQARRTVRSLTIGRVALHIPAFRRVISTCARLESLSLWDFVLISTSVDGAPVCVDSPGAIQTLSFETHRRCLRSLWLASIYMVSLPKFLASRHSAGFVPFGPRHLSLAHLDALENICLSRMVLSGGGFSAIAALPNLLRLDLGGTNLDHSSFAIIYPALTRLRCLDISNCSNLTDPHRFDRPPELKLPPQLELLDISSNRSLFAVPGGRYTPMAPPHCPLKEVRATHCELRRFDFLIHYAAGIKKLDLSRSSIHKSVNLAALLQRTSQLEVLVLYHVRVEPTFATDRPPVANCVFSAISRLACLKELNLAGIWLSRASVLSLVSGPCRMSMRELCMVDFHFVSGDPDDWNVNNGACHQLVLDSFPFCAVEWRPSEEWRLIEFEEV